ncbi:PE family protein, partial [Mycobacterium alsense]|uniref:PE family protein n=1 Tax=Mycobacterium alsense TaxID=324058 RepID=UPI001041C35C
MPFVNAAPEALATAAADLSQIEAAVSAANVAASAPTTAVLAAGADEVSAAIAALFSGHAREFQALGARAVAFQAQFAQNLTGGAASYASAEASAATVLQPVLTAINAPFSTLTGRPLIGNGVDGVDGTGA